MRPSLVGSAIQNFRAAEPWVAHVTVESNTAAAHAANLKGLPADVNAGAVMDILYDFSKEVGQPGVDVNIIGKPQTNPYTFTYGVAFADITVDQLMRWEGHIEDADNRPPAVKNALDKAKARFKALGFNTDVPHPDDELKLYNEKLWWRRRLYSTWSTKVQKVQKVQKANKGEEMAATAAEPRALRSCK